MRLNMCVCVFVYGWITYVWIDYFVSLFEWKQNKKFFWKDKYKNSNPKTKKKIPTHKIVEETTTVTKTIIKINVMMMIIKMFFFLSFSFSFIYKERRCESKKFSLVFWFLFCCTVYILWVFVWLPHLFIFFLFSHLILSLVHTHNVCIILFPIYKRTILVVFLSFFFLSFFSTFFYSWLSSSSSSSL